MACKSNSEGTILAFGWGWNLFFYYFDSRVVRQVTHGFAAITFNWSPLGERLITSGGELIDTTGRILRELLP